MNPLHADPEFAAAAGFPRPILHGLCTMGFAVKHILGAYAGGDPSAVQSIKVPRLRPTHPSATSSVHAVDLVCCMPASRQVVRLAG
jgi:acyl dehydratase